MPKGKKFDAAEKHFSKKEERYLRDLKYAREQQREAEETAQRIIKENEGLRQENEKLRVANEELRKAVGMSEEDLAKMLRDLDNAGKLSHVLDFLLNGRYGLGH